MDNSGMFITGDGAIWYGKSRETMIAVWYDETFGYVCSKTLLGEYSYSRLLVRALIGEYENGSN